jgi:predicted nucleic acid-binding OB-fold protein
LEKETEKQNNASVVDSRIQSCRHNTNPNLSINLHHLNQLHQVDKRCIWQYILREQEEQSDTRSHKKKTEIQNDMKIKSETG